jgi:ferredoxin
MAGDTHWRDDSGGGERREVPHRRLAGVPPSFRRGRLHPLYAVLALLPRLQHPVDPDSEKMVGFDLEHCKGCGICAAICPVNAKVIRKVGEELVRDDARLCIRMVEEGKLQE